MAVIPSAKEGGKHGDSDRRRSPQGDQRRVEIDEQGEVLEQETFAANRKGLRALERSKQSAFRNAALGRGGCRWHRAAPDPEAPPHRRASGGCPAQALLAGEGTLEWQRPKERCPGRYLHRPHCSAQRSAGLGLTRGWSRRPRRDLEAAHLRNVRTWSASARVP